MAAKLLSVKLGIIAGSGELPARVIEACRKSGREFFVIAAEGHTDPALVEGDVPHAWVRLGAFATTVRHLHQNECREVVMVGAVRRPSLWQLRPDLSGLFMMIKYGVLSSGDDSLLTAVVKTFESDEGIHVVGVHHVLPELLAPIGPIGTLQPSEAAWSDIHIAAEAALELGRQDIGQGAVAANGHVIAREGSAGTDAMLGALDENARGGVLVKMVKPGQERRADLPTIGVTTIKQAHAAGLKGIAVEAGGAIMADRQELKAEADKAGLFVIGIESNFEPQAVKGAPLVYLIAGEDSGDRLGANLMAALSHKTEGRVRFAGIGGETMVGERLESLFPMRDLAVMGFSEVLPRLPKLLRRISQTVEDIRRLKPDVVVSIDSPDFVFRVAARIKASMKNPPPIVHYVAPSVWAWRPGRAKKVARFLDHILCLLPFEPPYFEREGLSATFVGHPVVESDLASGDGPAFRARHAIGPSVPVVLALPGSRGSEIKMLAGVFGETLERLKQTHPELAVVVVAVEHQRENLEAITGHWPVSTVVVGTEEKSDAFGAADAALAASGTVALELAEAGVPNVIAYKVKWLTELVGKMLVKAKYANLINMVLDRHAIPERLFGGCRADVLATELNRLLDDPDARQDQRNAFDEALSLLGKGSHSPGARAADVVLETIKKEQE